MTTETSTYRLIDSGRFQKLEQIGHYRLIRPASGAVWQPALPESEWSQADATFERHKGGDGVWKFRTKSEDAAWLVQSGAVAMQLRCTDFGHLGVFAEQQANWRRLTQLAEVQRQILGRRPRILNLFAYTGGSTLAAAQGGAEVVHVDASKTSVAWARENASVSGLDGHPIRWIVEDVRKFVAREERRNSLYEGVILDPPSFGRGSKGQIWKIETDMTELLQQIKPLLNEELSFVNLSSHSQGYTPIALKNLLIHILGQTDGNCFAEEMIVPSECGRSLPSGATCFWVSKHDRLRATISDFQPAE